MRIAHVASEIAPYSRTGGLADVLGALPPALSAAGADILSVSPLYRCVREYPLAPMRLRVRVPVGDSVIEPGVYRSGNAYFLEHDPYFDRDALYGSPLGDFSDNVSRFIFLCRGALELLRQLGVPDIVHCHDWQTGLVPIYLKTLYGRAFGRTRSVFTIHNLAYQGLFWHLDMPLTGLDWKHYNWRELEFHDRLSFLKAALVHADAVTADGPEAVREIREEEGGCGMHGVLRERGDALHGIPHAGDSAGTARRYLELYRAVRSGNGNARLKA